MLTLEQTQKANDLLGKDINELEYIDHIVWENGKEYFQVISLDGKERLLEIALHLESVA
tara:strand:- start:1295 stop:1471 length:177 start_codon:yes stop_codon:yes gene_type:complete